MAALTGQIIVTTAGRAHLVEQTFAPTEIALGSTSWTPTESSTALQNEVARRPVASSVEQEGTDVRLQLVGLDSSSAAYTVREFAIFDGSGDCLMIYSQATAIATKASGSSLLLSHDLIVVNATTEDIDVDIGDVTYFLPNATTENSGLVELATQAEVNAGTDNTRGITPQTLAGRTATETRAGVVPLATQAEANAGTPGTKALTPVTLAGRTALTTRAGLVALATQAEVNAGSVENKAVTPAALEGRQATTSMSGLSQRGTVASMRSFSPSATAHATEQMVRSGLEDYAARVIHSDATFTISSGGTSNRGTFSGLRASRGYMINLSLQQTSGLGFIRVDSAANPGVMLMSNTLETNTHQFFVLSNSSGQISLILRNYSGFTVGLRGLVATAQLALT